MKLMINGYEVEIKAKAKWSKRANKEDTMDFLNTISLLASEAAKYNEQIKAHDAVAEWCDRISDEIYNVLKENGAYKNI